MYKFKNFHESGEIVRYVKMTGKTYYCRIPTSDGTNRFCYLDAEDAGGPGETEYPITEKEYKAVRGVTEQMFPYWGDEDAEISFG